MAWPGECRWISLSPRGRGEALVQGQVPRRGKRFRCGRAEPAPPGRGRAQRRSPTRESPEITREAIFSEGRGLRARVARPSACRGVLSSVVDTRKAGGFMTLRPRCAQPFPAGVRSPPLQGSQPKTDGLAGKTRAQRRGRFSRRGALCASGCRGRNQAQAQHDNRGQTNAWWPREHTPRSSASHPRGRAEPAPPCGPPYPALLGTNKETF
jgi:hypothetical protein